MIRDLLFKLLVISAFMMAGMQIMLAQFIDTTETRVKTDTTLMRSSLGNSDDDYAVLPMSITSKIFKTSFLHDDIDGTTVKQLIVLADPAPSYCAVDRKIRDARLKLRLKMGENDYEFAKNNDFIATVEVTATAMSVMNTVVETYICTLEVSVLTPSMGPVQMKPEQLKVFDIIDDYDDIEYFDITATFIGTPVLPTTDLEDNLWLDAEYTEEFTINPKKLSDTTEPVVNVVSYGNERSGTPVRFTWAVGSGEEGCTDNFPNYQLQILRLYNTNPAKTSETDIEAKVDWSEALAYEVGSGIKDITLTLAEGRGYYAWRVRPIGNVYPGEIANDLNWGVWSASLPDNTSVVISATSKPELSSDIKPSVFFYNGFDEHMNWIYARNFTEGSEATRIGEKMTYATSLLQAKQNQSKIQSKGDEFLIGQTVYDFSGRPTLVSLPAPVKQGGFDYNESFVQHESAPSVLETYSALNFDYDADAASGGSRASNYKEPNSINYGAVHAYYSDLNEDIQIPNADGYGFSRTVLYPDGTGRMQEQSGAGDVHRLKPATSMVDDRTIKSMYGGAPDAELIAMFGDEAPAASSVQKIFSVDPNKVISVKYVSKEGQTLATCLVKNTPSGPSSDLLEDLDNEASFEELVRDTIWNEPRQRRFVLPVETTVTMRYSIWPNQIQAECGSFCKTCEYRVYFYIHDLQDKTNTKLDSLIIDPKVCWDTEDWPKQKVLEWTLPAGSYIAERRIVSDNPVDISKPLEIHYEDQHAKEVEEMVEFEMDYFLDPIRAFLDSNNIEGLYSYLSTALDVTLDGDEYVLETECCTIHIPIKECGGLECPEEIEFEEMLYEKWGSEWGTTLDGYFWNVGGIPTYPATTPYTSNTGVFNDMIEHMIGDGYDCGELYAAWEVLVQTFGLLATTDGSGEIGMKNNEFDLLQTFLRTVGKKYEGFSDCPYGTCASGKKGYREYAYKYFYYEGQSPECEERTNLWADYSSWGADPLTGPYDDKEWEQFYNCWTGHKTTGIPTSAWMPSCEQKDTTCLKKYAEAVEDSCRSICWKRFPGFVESVKEAYRLQGDVIEGDKYLADGITLAGPLDIDISLHQVYCHAWSLVMHCESGCDLTIFRSDSAGIRKIDSIGSPAERDSLTKSMTYTYRVAIPNGENECPDSLYHVTNSTTSSEYGRMIISILNRELERVKKSNDSVFQDGNAVCQYFKSVFKQITGGSTCWACDIPSKNEGNIRLQSSEEPCPDHDDVPDMYAMGQNIVRSEFVMRGTCILKYLWTCQDDVPYYTDSTVVCPNACVNMCSTATCFAWIRPEIDAQAEIDVISCEKQAAKSLRNIIEAQVSECIDAHAGSIRRQYRENCVSPDDFRDTLSIEHEVGLYHFTLFYYDRAGNTVRTVPPNGVDLSSEDRYTHPNHTFITLYHYNSLGQLIAQITPDGGRTNSWYNSKGQLRFSQNAEQLNTSRPRFSYIKYDKLGRIGETGESLIPVVNDVILSIDLNLTAESPTFPMMGRRERTFTVYSKPAAGYSGYLGDGARQPRYLQNRVSYTHNDDGVATYYSYDPHGNVEWMEQWTPGLGGNYIGYKYDLISGNMLEVHYDSTVGDGYHHRYTYDADNRLVKVETSRDGSIWDRDASYTYYDYGPARSIALGEDHLQQLDYTYTIQGWLKGINHPSLDPAKDPGRNGYGGDRYAPDAFGMILGYYEGDFHRRYSSLQSVFNSSPTGPVYTQQQHDLQGGSLYNGNISSWTSNIIAAPSPPQPLEYEQLVGYTYRYDRLNRLLASDFRPYDLGMDEWPSAPSSEYATQTTYDPAGNIKTMNRTGYSSGGSHPLEMDEMTYVYESRKNHLRHVDDAVTGSNYEDDIDDQSRDNYSYDAIGNLIRDNQEGVRIRWNVYGKIDEVWRQKGNMLPPINQRTYYSYNAAGNRVRKEFINYTHPGESKVTFYVRDANEQVIAIYEQSLQVPGEGGTDCIMTSYQVVTNPDQILDTDLDWVADDCDGCDETDNPWQEDYDGDGVGDICDNCPLVHNPRIGGVQPACSGGGGGGGINGPELWWQQGEDPIVQHGWNSTLGQSRGGWMNTWPSLAELMIYGAKSHGRFGNMQPEELRDTVLWQVNQYTREINKKEYELHDHLDNVRIVVNDVKLNSGTSSSPLFTVDLKGYNNYYPFGMAEPSRAYKGSKMRYGFTGKEISQEMADGSSMYDFGARVYNSSVARWLSREPLSDYYSSLSPYAYAANVPISFTDSDGGVLEPAFPEGTSDAQRAYLKPIFDEIIEIFAKYSEQIRILKESHYVFKVRINTQSHNEFGGEVVEGDKKIWIAEPAVNWDPFNAFSNIWPEGGQVVNQSPAQCLFHELIHLYGYYFQDGYVGRGILPTGVRVPINTKRRLERGYYTKARKTPITDDFLDYFLGDNRYKYTEKSLRELNEEFHRSQEEFWTVYFENQMAERLPKEVANRIGFRYHGDTYTPKGWVTGHPFSTVDISLYNSSGMILPTWVNDSQSRTGPVGPNRPVIINDPLDNKGASSYQGSGR